MYDSSIFGAIVDDGVEDYLPSMNVLNWIGNLSVVDNFQITCPDFAKACSSLKTVQCSMCTRGHFTKGATEINLYGNAVSQTKNAACFPCPMGSICDGESHNFQCTVMILRIAKYYSIRWILV